MEFDFDFENIDIYLQPEVTVEMQSKINLLHSHIKVDKISEREHKFIGDLERRIKSNKPITPKQKIWLAKIVKRCRTETPAK